MAIDMSLGYYYQETHVNTMYYVEVLSLQPMKQYIIATMCLMMYYIVSVLFLLFCLVSLHGD